MSYMPPLSSCLLPTGLSLSACIRVGQTGGCHPSAPAFFAEAGTVCMVWAGDNSAVAAAHALGLAGPVSSSVSPRKVGIVRF